MTLRELAIACAANHWASGVDGLAVAIEELLRKQAVDHLSEMGQCFEEHVWLGHPKYETAIKVARGTEREACAKELDEQAQWWWKKGSSHDRDKSHLLNDMSRMLRARSVKVDDEYSFKCGSCGRHDTIAIVCAECETGTTNVELTPEIDAKLRVLCGKFERGEE